MPPMWYPFHHDEDEKERFQLSSIGIWTVALLNQEYFVVAVQQADQPGKPWGIPAGKIEATDISPHDAAARELYEETGIRIAAQWFHYITHLVSANDPKKGHLIFMVGVDKELNVTVREKTIDGLLLADPPSNVDRKEVAQLALIPIAIALSSLETNLLHVLSYKPKTTSLVLRRMQRELIARNDADIWNSTVDADWLMKRVPLNGL